MKARPPSAGRQGALYGPWWEEPEGGAHTALRHLIDHCETHYESRRRTETLLHLALYGDRHALARISRRGEESRLRFNLVKSVIDTLAAEIASMRPTAKILTTAGDWQLQRAAQRMELAVRGEFDACDIYGQARTAFLDAAKVGMTGYHVYQSGWRPKLETLQPGSLLVDPVEAMYGAPKAVYRLALLPRYEVLGRFGHDDTARAAITDCPEADHRHWFPWLPTDGLVDHILVIEAHREADPEDWRDAGKGRHVIAIDNLTLHDSEWDRPLPYALYRYDDDGADFYGRGVAQNLLSVQRELNFTLAKIQECIELAAGPIRWVPEGSIDIETMDDIPGAIVKYTGGQVPTLEVANTVPPQLLQHVEDLIRRGFEQEGVSQMSATARKPAGLNSGAALREYNDMGSKRFLLHSQQWEHFLAVETARRVIEEKTAISNDPDAKPPKLFATVYRGRKQSRCEVKWERMDQDSYQLQVQPTSALPTTPAGRTETVQDWIAGGLVSPEEGKALLGFPDLEAATDRAMATSDLVLQHVEEMLEDGTYRPPTTIQNLEQSIKLVTQSALLAESQGAPEDRTELLLRYIDDCRGYLEQTAPPMPPPGPPGAPPPPGGMPPDMGGAPPPMSGM